MRAFLFLAAAMIVTGCAAQRSESPAEMAIDYWVGRPIEAVIASWGEPTEAVVEDGRRLYIWQASHYDRRYYPANIAGEGRFPHLGGSEEIACRSIFEVDGEGLVVGAAWQGYECNFMP